MAGPVLVFVFAELAGFGMGGTHAHNTVATECQKLGKFYVGETVFECSEVKK